MNQLNIPADLAHLSVAERILLAEALWDSVVSDQAGLEVTPAQREELDRRLEDYHTSPGEGLSWDGIKEKMKGIK